MINVSNAFLERMEYNTRFLPHAVVTLTDGTVLTLDAADFAVGNNSISDGAECQGLPIGVAVERVVTLELMNDDERYRDIVFTGARIDLSTLFQTDDEGTIETILEGSFTVTVPETYGETVILTAADDMHRADRPYVTSLNFPATAANVLVDACNTAGISLQTLSFPNSWFQVAAPPSGNLTIRQVIGYVAMLAGGNARINRQGGLEIITYDFDYTGALHTLNAYKSLNAGTEDITITGVQTGKEDDTVVLVGTSDYVIQMENPLWAGNEQAAMDYLYSVLAGNTFRDFICDHIAYPIAEFMDKVKITDRRGRIFYSIITDVDFSYSGFTVLKNSAESAVRSRSQYGSAAVNTLIKAKQYVAEERSARNAALQNISQTLSAATGLYKTQEAQQDGSIIYYLHDKPTMAESATVIKMNSEAIGLSLNGGETWVYGVDFSGNAVLNKIFASGIYAGDAEVTGIFRVVRADGSTAFSINADTGEIYIKSGSVKTNTSVPGIETTLDAALNALETRTGNAETAAANASRAAQQASVDAGNAYLLNLILTADNFIIPTDPDGSGGDYSGCSTTLSVFYGSNDVTSEAAIVCYHDYGPLQVNGSDLYVNGSPLHYRWGGITGTWDPDSHTYTVSDLQDNSFTVIFEATYNNLTVRKTFTVIKAKQGITGATGETGTSGENGISIAAVDIWFYQSDYADSLSGGSWSTVSPAWTDGKYVWIKQVTAYSDGNTSESVPVNITGEKGNTGNTGIGIESTEEQYYLSESNTSQTGGSWETTATWEPGKYIWSRLKITYDDESIAYTNPVLADAINLANQNATDATETAQRASQDAANAYVLNVHLTSDSFIIPTDSDGKNGDYSSCKTTLSVFYGSNEVTSDATIACYHEYGNLKVNNADLYVNGMPLHYRWGGIAGDWDPDAYTFTVSDLLVDSYTVIFDVTYNNITARKTFTVIKAKQGVIGRTGETGETGSDGVSIVAVDIWFYQSTSSSSLSDGSWSTTRPAWVDGKYVWMKQVTAYSDGTSSESDPVNITGEKGETGASGTSVTIKGSYDTEAQLRADHPTGTEGDAYLVGADLYVWNGSDWQDVGQIQGPQGVSGTTYYIHIAYATSADGTEGFSTTESLNKTYIGQCVDSSVSDPETPASYRWSAFKGDTGVGIASTEEQYYLSTSNITQSDGSWGTTATWVSGKYIWSRLKISYDDGSIRYTDPVLADALNLANQNATDAVSTVNNMEIGGTNLIHQSNTLLFDMYGFFVRLVVNGSPLYVNGSELEMKVSPY